MSTTLRDTAITSSAIHISGKGVCEMLGPSSIDNMQTLAQYAAGSLERWYVLKGKKVVYADLGQGVVTRITEEMPEWIFITVSFGNNSDLTNKYLVKHFAELFDLAISVTEDDFMDARVNMRRDQEMHAQKSVQSTISSQSQQTKISATRTASSRKGDKRQASQKTEDRPMDPLDDAGWQSLLETYEPSSVNVSERQESPRVREIRSKINEGAVLTQEELDWLRQYRNYELLATYYETQAQKTSDPWSYILAVQNWRYAERLDDALSITISKDRFERWGSKEKAAFLTARGAALRVNRDLANGEKYAWHALDFLRSYHPYNLLGAIYWQSGQPEKGDQFFLKARELEGKAADSQDREITNAIRLAGASEKASIAIYLQQNDPERYRKFSRFLL